MSYVYCNLSIFKFDIEKLYAIKTRVRIILRQQSP